VSGDEDKMIHLVQEPDGSEGQYSEKRGQQTVSSAALPPRPTTPPKSPPPASGAQPTPDGSADETGQSE
jgi:hypothetical protein